MNVTLDPVTSALWPALANLAQFYQYDFSEIENGIVNLAGRFTYLDLGVLEPRLKEPGAEAWLLRVTDSEWGQDTLAGFAIALPAPDHPGAREIDEFFVMRRYRRLGIGRASADAILRATPGPWVVQGTRHNTGARDFWTRVITGIDTASHLTEHETPDVVYPAWTLQFTIS